VKTNIGRIKIVISEESCDKVNHWNEIEIWPYSWLLF